MSAQSSNFSSLHRLRKYTASCSASAKLTYSYSVEDKATVICFCNFQVIAPSLSINAYPVCDFLYYNLPNRHHYIQPIDLRLFWKQFLQLNISAVFLQQCNPIYSDYSLIMLILIPYLRYWVSLLLIIKSMHVCILDMDIPRYLSNLATVQTHIYFRSCCHRIRIIHAMLSYKAQYVICLFYLHYPVLDLFLDLNHISHVQHLLSRILPQIRLSLSTLTRILGCRQHILV